MLSRPTALPPSLLQSQYQTAVPPPQSVPMPSPSLLQQHAAQQVASAPPHPHDDYRPASEQTIQELFPFLFPK